MCSEADSKRRHPSGQAGCQCETAGVLSAGFGHATGCPKVVWDYNEAHPPVTVQEKVARVICNMIDVPEEYAMKVAKRILVEAFDPGCKMCSDKVKHVHNVTNVTE